MLDRPVRMPRLAFLVAWQLEELGEPHPVIGPNNYYMTDEFRTTLRQRSLDGLARLGLASAGGVLTPDFRQTLTTIARPGREFYSWSNFPDRSEDDGAILVAALGHDAVRLITDQRTVRLDPVPAERLCEHFVETLPDVPGADVRPLHVAATDFADPGGRREDDPFAEPDREAERLWEIMRADRDAAHQLYAAARDGSGARNRSLPISAVDLTARGRVLTYLDRDERGGRRINLFPGNRENLLTSLGATIDTL
ncbi:ESX secretion-associated protein EspG [Amycolatopsis samaneae]|uniref:ESX secretion-associated protein EspG n=1 Tax=Amycolatopsis samaneae TaxID=664691 RepID=UPI0031EEBA71